MLRRFGTLAAGFAFGFVAIGGAFHAETHAATPATAATMTAAADTPSEGNKKPEVKKKRRRPARARRLHGKLRHPHKARPKPKYKPWSKVITGEHKKLKGLIPIYTKGESVLFVIHKDMLDKPMLANMTLSRGIGSNFINGGLPIDNVMFDFHRETDHLQIRRLSVNYRAPGDSALQKALALSYTPSVLASLPIASEKGSDIVVGVNKFFLSDISGMGATLTSALRQPVRMARTGKWFDSVKNYPQNTEIDTRLTYSPANAAHAHLPNVPDPRFIQVGVHYSIFKLPEVPMTPRIADDRVGYFTTTHKDFSRTGEESFFVHYANRWRLEKKDPSAKLSEPKKPIVYYLDRTIPREYREAIREGTLYWNRAFEEAGFKNAVVVRDPPTPEEDPEYDPADARYHTLRWDVSDALTYGAIGPSQVDPRTGEILNADVLFEHSMVAGFGKSYRRLAAPREALMRIDPRLRTLWMTPAEREKSPDINDTPQWRNKGYTLCAINDVMSFGGYFLGLNLMERGQMAPDGKVPRKYIMQALHFVAAHEVGHTLGLRHNFMSSGCTPFQDLNNRKIIEDIGMTGSVMDYPTPNVALHSKDQGYYYTPTVGTADRWAITWGYSVVPGDDEWAQKKSLEPLAEECSKKSHLYGTDEDTYPMGALDPRSNTNDLSDNPLAWAKERIAVCDDLLNSKKLEDRVVAAGENYVPLRSAVQTLFVQRYLATRVAVKYVGGQFTSRAHKGSGHYPFVPVPASVQRDALKFAVKNGLRSSAYSLPPAMLNRLGDNKQWSWQNNMFQFGRRFDFPMSEWVSRLQNAVLANLLNPWLQARVVDTEYKMDRPFRLSELYNTLTQAIWTSNPAPHGRTAVWDRNLQRLYTHRLIAQITTPYAVTPQDAMALSRLHLKRIRKVASTALQKTGLDDVTNAHLMETVAQINRALDAKRITGF